MFSALWDLFGSVVRALFDLGGAVLRVVFQLFSAVASAIFWPFRATWGLVSGNWGSLGPWTPAYLGVCVVVFLALLNWRWVPVFLVLGLAAIPFLPETIYNRILTIFRTGGL